MTVAFFIGKQQSVKDIVKELDAGNADRVIGIQLGRQRRQADTEHIQCAVALCTVRNRVLGRAGSRGTARGILPTAAQRKQQRQRAGQ